MAKAVRRETIEQILKGAHPEVARMLRAAHEQKFRVRRTNSGHFQVLTPEGVRPCRLTHQSATPSDTRSVNNARSQLRRLGVKLPR